MPVVGAFRDYTYDVHDLDLSRLIPARAQVNRVWYVQRKDFRDAILIEWTDPTKRFAHGLGKLGPRPFRWGLRLWTSTPTYGPAPAGRPRRLYDGSRWRAVDIPVVKRMGTAGPNMSRIAFADVTSDGVPDLLFEQAPGTNHGCGPHQIFATSRSGVTTRTFSSYMCETMLQSDHGLLALDMPYYIRNDAMCCPSFRESLLLRWNGSRYVTASLRIR
jgi:hypothetical protein